MKVTLTRYILIPKCQAENACFIYPSMEKKYILKIPTEILAHFICKLFFILREQLRYDHPNIYIKKGKKGSLEALQSVDSTEYINERNILLTSFLSGVSGRAISKTLFFLENDLTTYYMLYKSSESTINLRNA